MEKDGRNILSREISLPEDAGPHHLSNTEWWYYFAFLKGDKGGNYATMASFFRTGEFKRFKGHYLIFSLIDLNRNTHRAYSYIDCKMVFNMLTIYLPYYLIHYPCDKKIWKLYWDLLRLKLPSPHQWMGNVSILKNPTRLRYGKSSLFFTNEMENNFRVYMLENRTIIDLQFSPKKPIALIGQDGKPDKLFYYSFTRNEVEGRINNGGIIENVIGTGWFDHQWGIDYSLLQKTGWNWFGIQLEDGRELLINQFHSFRAGETFSPMANLIEKDGEVKFTRDVKFHAEKCWKSPLTNAVYPLQWAITIPEFNMKMTVVANFEKQEMPIIGVLQAIWEGTCSISGEEGRPNQKKRQLHGKGFMELVGYA